MSYRESEQFIEPLERIEFSDKTFCALKRGFEENPGLVGELERTVGKEEVKFYFEIVEEMENSPNLVKSYNIGKVYSKIAERELERISAEDEDDDDLSCEHTVEDHQEGLREVLKILKQTIH